MVLLMKPSPKFLPLGRIIGNRLGPPRAAAPGMRYKVVFEDLRRVFRKNPDVLFLVEQVENDNWACRKQLADMVFADRREARRISMTTRGCAEALGRHGLGAALFTSDGAIVHFHSIIDN